MERIYYAFDQDGYYAGQVLASKKPKMSTDVPVLQPCYLPRWEGSKWVEDAPVPEHDVASEIAIWDSEMREWSIAPKPTPELTEREMIDAMLPAVRAQAAQTYSDPQLIGAIALFAGYVWESDKDYTAQEVLMHEGRMYQVMQAHRSLAHQPPGSEGMLAVYRPIVQGHAGTVEDPVPYVDGLDVKANLVHSYEGKLYTADRDVPACTYYPGQPGVHFWTEVLV